MAKHSPAGSVNRSDIQNRIKDEMRGIRQGAVDLNPPAAKEEEPVPDISELGVPLPIRTKLKALIAEHAELGEVAREAEKSRKKVTDAIKTILEEHIDVPSFQCGEAKVTQFTQRRPSLSKDVLRVALLNRGVKPSIVSGAIEEATTINEVKSLKITRGREDE